MKSTLRAICTIVCGICLIARGLSAEDKIKVVTTIPDLADMTRQIGGDLVDVSSLATGVEDIHAVPMKPSFAVTLNKADAVVVVGLEAEHAFMPALLDASRNPKIQRDQPGYIDTSVYITPLEVPTRIDRALGDQHPMGNPHINLDPVLAKDMVRAIADGLARLDPANESTYKANLVTYTAKLDAAIARWEKEAAPLKGVPVVVYHKDFSYFINWAGMREVASLEPKPGIPPTPSHLAELIDQMKSSPAKVIVYSPYNSSQAAEFLSSRANIPVVMMPFTVGGSDKAKDLFGLFDDTIQRLLGALK